MCIRDRDYILGRLVNALEETGQLENTIIFITSDNGPEMELWPDSGFSPFRGAKGSTWEGGMRVPGIFYWKDMISPGRISDGLFDLADLFNTSLALSGAKDQMPTDRYIDGIDQTSFLLTDNGQSNRKYIYYWLGSNFSAVRVGEYKYMMAAESDDDPVSYTHLTPFLKKMLIEFMAEPDPLYAMLEWLTNELMKLEAENKVGAHKGEHCPTRTTHFSGTRVRRFDTRLGTIYLLVPKLRKGGYIPFFVTERKRSEQALLQVVQEAFINGVSTRKMERLAQSLGIESFSASQVSEITKDLNEQVEWFRTRPLEKEYPVIWVDALYERCV